MLVLVLCYALGQLIANLIFAVNYLDTNVPENMFKDSVVYLVNALPANAIKYDLIAMIVISSLLIISNALTGIDILRASWWKLHNKQSTEDIEKIEW